MNVLDTTIANVSLPAIAGDLGVSPTQGTWVITSFAVANAIAVPLTGWMTQRLGQLRLFLYSVLAFVCASLACGLAPTLESLIFFRVVQGLVAGPMIPLSQTLLLSVYPPALAGLATAVYGWLCGRVQSDVKSALVYATVMQVGLMVAACGLGWFTLAAWHLALHALWRGYQFLMAPSYLLLAPDAAKTAARLPPLLTRRVTLYTAVLQGFWLDRLARGLLLRPTLSLGRDMRQLDDRVIDRLLGVPPDAARGTPPLGSGVAGRALMRLSELAQQVEDRLVLQSGGGAMARGLRRLGDAIRSLEDLIEQPRYLMLMVMATFVVIL